MCFADLALFESKSSVLRSNLGGSLPASQASAMQEELETAQRRLVELQKYTLELEAAQGYKQAVHMFGGAERSVLLAKISDMEQDRTRVQKQLQLQYAKSITKSEDSIKAILADKDAVIERLQGALMREQADTSLRIQTVQQAQV